MKLNYTMAKEFPLECVVGVDFVLWLRYKTQRKGEEEIPTRTNSTKHTERGLFSFLGPFSTENSRKQNVFFGST